MMNMHKLGTVSPAAQLFNNPTKSSAIKYLRLMRYTLCVGMAYFGVLQNFTKTAIFNATPYRVNGINKCCIFSFSFK